MRKCAGNYPLEAGGRWLSPGKRLVWDQEIGGSNPPRPTSPGDLER